MKTFFLVLLLAASLPALAQKAQKQEPPLFDVDISGSAGNYNGAAYTEILFGLNVNFEDWLTWRNAAFKRFNSQGAQDVSGFDSGLRFTYDQGFDGGGLKFFAGPGYRWAFPSDKNALFAEAGAGINVGKFNLTGGAKYLRYDRTQTDAAGVETKRDDLSYFIGVSGGMGLSF